jgi:ferredoxin
MGLNAYPARSYAVGPGCVGCGACLATCPGHAIRPAEPGPLLVLATRCTGCGECVEVCPVDVIVETVGVGVAGLAGVARAAGLAGVAG